MPGSVKDVSKDKSWTDEWQKRGNEPCLGTLKLYTSKKGFRQVLFCVPPKAHRFRMRKRSSRFITSTRHMRYRERIPPQHRNFYGDAKGRAIKNGFSVLGKFQMFQNKTSTYSENMIATGVPSSSVSLERCWDMTNPGPPFHAAGPFAYLKSTLPNMQTQGQGKYTSLGNPNFSPDSWWQYEGFFVDSGGLWGSDSTSNYQALGVPALTGYDTLAWDQLKPKVSKANLAQFLYELKDLPHMLESTANALWNSWRSFGGGYSSVVMHPKSVADNFLNHEFGWRPFLQDMFSFFDVFHNSEKYIADIVQQNNTWVRKKRVLEETESDQLLTRYYQNAIVPSTASWQIAGCCKNMTIDGIDCAGFADIREIKKNRVWAVGEFKFYRPEFDDSLSEFSSQFVNIQRLMTLYGLRINPTVLYKVTPWTWAVDWFTQFGRLIERVDDFIVDGIVSKYLNIMRRTERLVRKTSVTNFYSGSMTLHWERNQTMKQRIVSDSPYGFGQPWATLSPKQWAILGSIGITRSGSGFISRG